eukprot:gene43495-54028_t
MLTHQPNTGPQPTCGQTIGHRNNLLKGRGTPPVFDNSWVGGAAATAAGGGLALPWGLGRLARSGGAVTRRRAGGRVDKN